MPQPDEILAVDPLPQLAGTSRLVLGYHTPLLNLLGLLQGCCRFDHAPCIAPSAPDPDAFRNQ